MPTLESLTGITQIHLVGIGGIGVSALAPLLCRKGFTVTGSDPARNAVTDRLEKQGILIHHDHKAENIGGASLLVVTSAVKEDNPELQAARAKGIPIWPRAKMLGCLLRDYRAVVITGAHGKTTVTGMCVEWMLDSGLDPTAFVGGDLERIGGNSRVGQGEWAVAEGDESDGSFVYLQPEIAVVNNIDADHLDFYPDLDAIIASFNRFLEGVREGGWIVTSADCVHCRRLTGRPGVPRLSYGFAGADIQAVNFQPDAHGSRCEVLIHGKRAGSLRLRVSGRMHCHNALAALAVSHLIGVSFAQASESLSRFEGVRRRLEWIGEAEGVTVIDDYAHHPTEIQATIQALRDRSPSRLIGVFQPHLYSRTLKLLDEFGGAFTGLDLLILTDIYPAREKPVPGVTGEVLKEPVQRHGVEVAYVPRLEDAASVAAPLAKAGDVIVTLGAGDVWKAGRLILEDLRKRKAGEGT
ncbi:MAG TPA: UDP-N-acetylmuramate--L-alanine ligase [bacterium]|nr:UDP-N-acetylmuramate--L-alanine ligase [Candidatus Omnitrophota bacterium]HOL92880.1 UDP-N-acetylmuramate--L-alanine ligase [bacterium]HPO99943.1 UDP-N-acetylmuramate--L-alanine ligase [bacterium]